MTPEILENLLNLILADVARTLVYGAAILAFILLIAFEIQCRVSEHRWSRERRKVERLRGERF